MTVELVDGRAGKPHIDGDDLGDFKLGFCGGGYVLGTGDVLKATQPSANKVTVATGSAVMPLTGRHVRVTAPETVAVTSGTQGQKRRDIVVLRASTGSGVESASLVCLRGTPVSYGTPADPAVPKGDLALYRVTLDGASVSKPEPVFKVLRSAADLEELWDSVSQAVVKAANVALDNFRTSSTEAVTAPVAWPVAVSRVVAVVPAYVCHEYSDRVVVSGWGEGGVEVRAGVDQYVSMTLCVLYV